MQAKATSRKKKNSPFNDRPLDPPAVKDRLTFRVWANGEFAGLYSRQAAFDKGCQLESQGLKVRVEFIGKAYDSSFKRKSVEA